MFFQLKTSWIIIVFEANIVEQEPSMVNVTIVYCTLYNKYIFYLMRSNVFEDVLTLILKRPDSMTYELSIPIKPKSLRGILMAKSKVSFGPMLTFL